MCRSPLSQKVQKRMDLSVLLVGFRLCGVNPAAAHLISLVQTRRHLLRAWRIMIILKLEYPALPPATASRRLCGKEQRSCEGGVTALSIGPSKARRQLNNPCASVITSLGIDDDRGS